MHCTCPLDPRRTNIPDFGTSNVRSDMAVTADFELNFDVLNVFLRFRTEIATLLGIDKMSIFRLLQNVQDLAYGFGASYNFFSSKTAR